LIGRFPDDKFDPESPYRLRLTAIREDLTSILLQATRAGPLAQGEVVELDYLRFRVEAVDPVGDLGFIPSSKQQSSAEQTGTSVSGQNGGSNPWAAVTSYQELSAPYLLAQKPAPKHITLRFTSPTTFKSGGMHVPIPLPELTFGSLLERWNSFAPIAFPPEARRYAAECLAIGRYDLSSRVVPTKGRGLRVGAVGEVRYTCLNYDRYWMSLMTTLARFALFAGVGAGTGMGLGQCRME
jgi:CRISPR-associated endoribonuclease Cas6